MLRKIRPIVFSLFIFGVFPLVLQVIPLVIMFSLFLTPVLIVGYYLITRKLLKSGNFNLLTAAISSLIAVILSYNFGVFLYILGSIFWGKRSYSDITNVLGIFSLSSFPVSALIGSVSAKLYFDMKTKSKIFKIENVFVLFFIIVGIIIFAWNFKYLEANPAREQARKEAELQKVINETKPLCAKEENCCVTNEDCKYIWFTGTCNTPEYVTKIQKEVEEQGRLNGEARPRENVTCTCESNQCVTHN